ncbi:hypothetical protein H4219_000486 [Mycoemilia scoparia]|uniref:Uncharacterized protein n=1 Tax=Mycoemilia scoparia TaxID=417184 RepID=A0A9W8A5X1_9FUNG|nr:hypothetical protein H4219_000486 [Mycoemilia scoparia]
MSCSESLISRTKDGVVSRDGNRSGLFSGGPAHSFALPSPVSQMDTGPAAVSASASTGSIHSFLQINFEPFVTTTLWEILEMFVLPYSSSSPDIPNTPPPLYEPPPPSYTALFPEGLQASLSRLPPSMHRTHSTSSSLWSRYTAPRIGDESSSQQVSEGLQRELDLHLTAYEELSKLLKGNETTPQRPSTNHVNSMLNADEYVDDDDADGRSSNSSDNGDDENNIDALGISNIFNTSMPISIPTIPEHQNEEPDADIFGNQTNGYSDSRLQP